MNINKIYLKFLQKVNKNFTNDNISVDKGRFIFIFNEATNKFIEWCLEKRNEDDIREIQKLLVNDFKINLKYTNINSESFSLPENYFSFSSIQVFANKDGCKNQKLDTFEIKSENKEEVLNDEFNKPDFKYRETCYIISNDTVTIFTDKFNISKAFLTYYKYPVQVDIEGYIKLDGSLSTNIDSEFDEKVVDRIISIAAKDFNINDDNMNRFTVDKDRINSRT